MTKNENKSNVVLIESMPPSLCFSLVFVYFCCWVYIWIYFLKIKCNVALLM